MQALLFVFIGGGLGSLCRYALTLIIDNTSLPKATLLANCISCLILGILMGLSAKHIIGQPQRLLLMTGFCGGFSTFSTFSSEMISLYQDGQIIQALGYGAVSLLIGVGSILIGLYLGSR